MTIDDNINPVLPSTYQCIEKPNKKKEIFDEKVIQDTDSGDGTNEYVQHIDSPNMELEMKTTTLTETSNEKLSDAGNEKTECTYELDH